MPHEKRIRSQNFIHPETRRRKRGQTVTETLTRSETVGNPPNFSVAGQIGLVGFNMRSSKEALIGDTLHRTDEPVEALPGFEPSKPMVFAGVYPLDQSQHVNLRSAIEKLALNDSAVTVSVDTR